jgi:hypothetical protein
MTAKRFLRPAIAAGAFTATLLLAAASQAAESGPQLKRGGEVTETVTVVSFDPATRHLVVKTPEGETETLSVPTEARNAQNLKPGDTIKATYRLEAAIRISPHGAGTVENSQTMVASRAEHGALPGGRIASRTIVTGAVVAVDNAAHTVKLVNPQGGEVHTIYVPSEEGRALLAKLKPGDKVTAEISESLLISTRLAPALLAIGTKRVHSMPDGTQGPPSPPTARQNERTRGHPLVAAQATASSGLSHQAAVPVPRILPRFRLSPAAAGDRGRRKPARRRHSSRARRHP